MTLEYNFLIDISTITTTITQCYFNFLPKVLGPLHPPLWMISSSTTRMTAHTLVASELGVSSFLPHVTKFHVILKQHDITNVLSGFGSFS